MWRRLRALVIKELLAIFRDPRSRFILIGPPLMQILIFSYAATLEVTNIDIGVLNRDAGRWSAEFLQRLDGAPAFRSIKRFSNPDQVREAINRRAVIGVLQFGADFSRDLSAGRPASAQLLLDGRRSNAAQIIAGYMTAIANDISSDISISQSPRDSGAEPKTTLVSRYWFNPNLDNFWFIVPSLMGTLALLLSLVITGQSVARERELGTFDQLMVSPLRVSEILIGKTLPPLIVGLVQISAFLCIATFFFQVPFRGSLLLLYLGAVFFLASTIGVGLFISSLSQTQQQAFLGAFLFIAPAILLSGFATPVENMPKWLQLITLVDPLRHFLVIIRGVFLKGMPAIDVAANIFPLFLIAIFTLSVAAWLFRSRME